MTATNTPLPPLDAPLRWFVAFWEGENAQGVRFRNQDLVPAAAAGEVADAIRASWARMDADAMARAMADDPEMTEEDWESGVGTVTLEDAVPVATLPEVRALSEPLAEMLEDNDFAAEFEEDGGPDVINGETEILEGSG
ncbi:hypothetical protein ACQ5SO_09820 [Rhodovulum sp. DZ06]|uniref:hypothetical protein n=1 Tax=Rhodovulum sp. DZ06 TaxID=3425126 RepID=UPI003D35263E